MKKVLLVLILLLMCNKVFASPVFMPEITVSECKEKLMQLSGKQNIMLVSESEHLLVFERHDGWSTERQKQSVIGHYVFGTPLHSDAIQRLTISFIKKDNGVLISCSCDVLLNQGQPNAAKMHDENASQELTRALEKEAQNRAKRLNIQL